MIPSVLIKVWFVWPIVRVRNYREIRDPPASQFLAEGGAGIRLFDIRSRIAISSISFTNYETDGDKAVE